MQKQGIYGTAEAGRFVESLNGRYITAEDVNTSVHDMEYIFMETKYVTGVAPAHGGSGDPSPVTAYGVFRGMQASAQEAFGSESLAGKKVAVQGLGSVGSHLLEHLSKAEAKIIQDQKKVRSADDEMKWARVEIRVPWFDKANPKRELVVVEKNTNLGDWVDPTSGTRCSASPT